MKARTPPNSSTNSGSPPSSWKYRIASRYHHPAPLQDAQPPYAPSAAGPREWNLDPHKIGIWGFRVGGHLASTAATHFDDGKTDAEDPIEKALACRPDFAILCYPVTAV